MASVLIALRRQHLHSFSNQNGSSFHAFSEFLDPKDWIGNFDIDMLMLDG